jgi:hypothetical protein
VITRVRFVRPVQEPGGTRMIETAEAGERMRIVESEFSHALVLVTPSGNTVVPMSNVLEYQTGRDPALDPEVAKIIRESIEDGGGLMSPAAIAGEETNALVPSEEFAFREDPTKQVRTKGKRR